MSSHLFSEHYKLFPSHPFLLGLVEVSCPTSWVSCCTTRFLYFRRRWLGRVSWRKGSEGFRGSGQAYMRAYSSWRVLASKNFLKVFGSIVIFHLVLGPPRGLNILQSLLPCLDQRLAMMVQPKIKGGLPSCSSLLIFCANSSPRC